MAMTFRERLAWLGRMPAHYRILFCSQLMLTAVAIQYRIIIVERRRRELIKEESALSMDTPELNDRIE